MTAILVASCAGCTYVSSAPNAAKAATTDRLIEAFSGIHLSDRDTERQQAFIRSQINLADPDVASVVVAALNGKGQQRLRGRIQNVMACVVCADPGKTIAWMMRVLDGRSALGRANCLRSLRCLDSWESHRLLSMFMGDLALVPQTYREPAPWQRYAYRVCDYAYDTWAFVLRSNQQLPDGLPPRLYPRVTYSERDDAIRKLRAWAEGDGKALLDGKSRCGGQELAQAIKKLAVKVGGEKAAPKPQIED